VGVGPGRGTEVFAWLTADEARELAEALTKAVGWLADEEAASTAYTRALDEEHPRNDNVTVLLRRDPVRPA
jgi:hypothetical protein